MILTFYYQNLKPSLHCEEVFFKGVPGNKTTRGGIFFSYSSAAASVSDKKCDANFRDKFRFDSLSKVYRLGHYDVERMQIHHFRSVSAVYSDPV